MWIHKGAGIAKIILKKNNRRGIQFQDMISYSTQQMVLEQLDIDRPKK